MTIFLIGLIIFLGIHFVRILAPEWREAQIAQRGEGQWKGIYSGVSIVSLVVLIYGYSLWRPDAGEIYSAPEWGRSAAFIIMFIAFILMMVGNLKAGLIKEKLKHPFTLATILWALAHLLANGDAATVTLNGAFLVWAVATFISSSRRNVPDPVSTGITPDIIAVVSGIIIWAIFVFFAHEWLFGVALA